MAIEYVVIEYEVGDKVVANTVAKPLERNIPEVEKGTALTIARIHKTDCSHFIQSIYLSFTEVGGQYNECDFDLHDSVVVKKI